MAQHDMNIANQGFPATRADLNNALQALATNSSGTSAPSTTFANQWWYDTTNNKLYIRNEANNAWIQVAVLDQTNNEWQITTGQITAGDSDGLVFKTDDGNTRITLSDGGDVTFADGTDIITASAGTDNVRIGEGAGDSIASGGNNNVVVGKDAGTAITTGDNNTIIGHQSGQANTTGQQNVAIGYQSLYSNTTADFNSALGWQALYSNTTGTQNIAVGPYALHSNTTASTNTAMGYAALEENSTGASNTAIGYKALEANTTASNNTALGYEALRDNTTGAKVTAVGLQALRSNTTGVNSAFGAEALFNNTTGSNNTALGRDSLFNNTTGDHNTAVGQSSLESNTTGARNTAVGSDCLDAANGNDNTSVGYLASTSVTSAVQGTHLGSNAGIYVTSGSYNVLIGYQSGSYVTGLTTGQANTLVGSYTRTTAVGSDDANGFGYDINADGGYTTIGRSLNDIRAQHGSTTWSTVSDERYKKDITDSTVGLSFINALRPRTFNYRERGDLPVTFRAYEEGSTEVYKSDQTQHGFIAQEVKTAIDAESGIQNGFKFWDERSDGSQEVAETALIPVLVKAIQQLSAKNDALEARIVALEG